MLRRGVSGFRVQSFIYLGSYMPRALGHRVFRGSGLRVQWFRVFTCLVGLFGLKVYGFGRALSDLLGFIPGLKCKV